jgi:hypothetical protein
MNYKEINKNIDKTMEELYLYQGKVLSELKKELNSKMFYTQARKLFNIDKMKTNKLVEFYELVNNSEYELPKNFEIFMLIYDKLRNEDKNSKGISKIYNILKLSNDYITKNIVIEYFNNKILEDIRNRGKKRLRNRVKDVIEDESFDINLFNFDIKTRIEKEAEEKVIEKYNNNTVYFFKEWNKEIGKLDELFDELKEETLKENMDTKIIAKISNDINKIKKEEKVKLKKLNEILEFKKQYVSSQNHRLH